MTIREKLAIVESSDFEQFVIEDVFPSATNTPGTVNRAGVSAIKS